MTKENNKLDKLYLEQEKELGQAEFILDAVTDQIPIFNVCKDQSLSEFLEDEKMVDVGKLLPRSEGGFYYIQHFTNDKSIQHEFDKDGTVVKVDFLQYVDKSNLDNLISVGKIIEKAIDLQKKINLLEEN